MNLTINYRDRTVESFKNIKTESRAWEIINKRHNVLYATYNGRIITGAKPKKLKRPDEMSLEEMERLIRRM